MHGVMIQTLPALYKVTVKYYFMYIINLLPYRLCLPLDQ